MRDALEDHEGTVSIGGRTITNLRFAYDIDGLAEEEEEPAKLAERLNKASTAYGMEINAEKTKMMTSNTSGIKVNGQKLETITIFKYLGSVVTDEGFEAGIPSRIAQTTTALTRLKKNTSHGNEVLPQDTTHLIQRPCYQRGSSCHNSAGNRTTRRPPDHRKETQTAVVWSCFPFIRSGQNHLSRHSERWKKTRQTEEEMGRQYQGMDRPGVH